MNAVPQVKAPSPPQAGRVCKPRRRDQRALVPQRVQLAHLDRIEELVARELDIFGNGDPVEARLLPQREDIDAEQVAEDRRLARRLEGPQPDAAQRPGSGFRRRQELAVVNDVDLLAPRTAARAGARGGEAEHAAADEDADADAAVDMHLVESQPSGLHVEEHRRKRDRDRSGSQHDLAKQLHRLGPATGSDQPHVPDPDALRVEVGRGDVEPSAAVVRCCDPAQELGVDLLLDQQPQGSGIRQRLPAEELRDDRQHPENVARRSGRVELRQRIVVSSAEKRERRHQRAGRDTGDDLERRALSGLRPANEEPCSERPVRPASRQRQVRVVNDTVRTDRKLVRRLLLEGAGKVPPHCRAGRPRRGADIGHAGDDRLAHQLYRHRIARQAAAAGEEERSRDECYEIPEIAQGSARVQVVRLMKERAAADCAGSRMPVRDGRGRDRSRCAGARGRIRPSACRADISRSPARTPER